MKIILKIFFYVVFACLLFPINLVGKTAINYDQDSILLADSLVLYYLDGAMTNHDSVMKLYDEDKITGYGFRDSRAAIRNCGERARNGILLFETKK